MNRVAASVAHLRGYERLPSRPVPFHPPPRRLGAYEPHTKPSAAALLHFPTMLQGALRGATGARFPLWVCARQGSPARRAAAISAMAAPAGSVSIVWYRVGDLRVADHAPLLSALQTSPAAVVPLFCLDAALLRPFPPDGRGLPATGPHRLQALLQALQALRAALQQRGSDILCFTESTPDAVRRLAAAVMDATRPNVINVHFYNGIGASSAAMEDAVCAALQEEAAERGVAANIDRHWGCFLYHPDALPAEALRHKQLQRPARTAGSHDDLALRLAGMAPTMSDFRRALQAGAMPQRPSPAPVMLPVVLPGLLGSAALASDRLDIETASLAGLFGAAGATETLERLHSLTGGSALDSTLPLLAQPLDARSELPFAASEEAGLLRLRHYLGQHNAADNGGGDSAAAPIVGYGESRMLAGGVDNSAKLAAFLSLGSLSPRTVFWETLHAMLQQEHVADALTSGAGSGDDVAPGWRWSEPPKFSPGHHWLLMHLGIRDFFLYAAARDGAALYSDGGPSGREVPWSRDADLFQRWAAGRTGVPFVDASMRELAATGYTSNRGRQNVASYLAKALGVDWRLGAELFQALLACHDPSLNWGNWAYVAGVGADPRDRAFRCVTQGERYDPEAELIAAWVPELAALPARLRHRPWEATAAELAAAGVRLADVGQGGGAAVYPLPLVDPASLIAKGK